MIQRFCSISQNQVEQHVLNTERTHLKDALLILFIVVEYFDQMQIHSQDNSVSRSLEWPTLALFAIW